MRIFLDANIIFSAIKSDGAVRKLLALLRGAGHELIANHYAMEEAIRNIRVKSDEEDWHNLEGTVIVLPVPHHLELPPDIDLVDKDRPVLASALWLKCDVLLTGDRTHFGHLYGTRVEGVTIHSPHSTAELLLIHWAKDRL